MKILLINGSPRIGGNTEILLNEAKKGAEEIGIPGGQAAAVAEPDVSGGDAGISSALASAGRATTSPPAVVATVARLDSQRAIDAVRVSYYAALADAPQDGDDSPDESDLEDASLGSVLSGRAES